MDLYHEFDWRGFSFFIKGVTLCGLLIACAPTGIATAYTYFSPNDVATVEVARTIAPNPSDGAVAGTTTLMSERTIASLNLDSVVPKTGKFVTADLVNMRLTLYQDGEAYATYPILTKGRPGSPYETPSGYYSVLTREENHLNRREQVYMPYSMQFYGNYFIHGWPYFTDGKPVATTYSGGCIRLSSDDAKKVYGFVQKGTGLFVYDPGRRQAAESLALATDAPPTVSASAYLVADIDTGDVLLERNATTTWPIASVTKLMTALVANETIMFDREIDVPTSIVKHTELPTTVRTSTFVVSDLLYPLLMESNNDIAASLANFYGTPGFVAWMNTTAKALEMSATNYADASGISPNNISTTEDLYRLAVYLTNKKSFIWDITRTPQKKITSRNGLTFTFSNFNEFSALDYFVGGKVGHTGQALDTMMSVFRTPVNGVDRRLAIIVLHSNDYTADTTALERWTMSAIARGVDSRATACVTCANKKHRKISF
jgi:D-alanyl-D-alanine endopeptidase (penicillin-binding protein 7)